MKKEIINNLIESQIKKHPHPSLGVDEDRLIHLYPDEIRVIATEFAWSILRDVQSKIGNVSEMHFDNNGYTKYFADMDNVDSIIENILDDEEN